MTRKDKELLLKDLSARLPYGVKVAIEYSEGKYTRIYDLREIDNDVTSELRQRVTVWNYGFYSSVISYPLISMAIGYFSGALCLTVKTVPGRKPISHRRRQ